MPIDGRRRRHCQKRTLSKLWVLFLFTSWCCCRESTAFLTQQPSGISIPDRAAFSRILSTGRRRIIQRVSHDPSSHPHTTSNHNNSTENTVNSLTATNYGESSKRRGIVQALAVASLSTPLIARAGLPEIDSSGQLFSPKSAMLSGGSDAARGIPLTGSRKKLQPGETLQTVYNTRFITYLARFLLNFDPAANAWWTKQGFIETWELSPAKRQSEIDIAFAEFAESVEVGLANYFVGPYGSYSSLSAARAGLSAANPAPSQNPMERRGLFEKILMGNDRKGTSERDVAKSAKQGVLNLLTLLKERYKSLAAKRQLAILFSFLSYPQLQPTKEICALLGEADNATISEIAILKYDAPIREVDSRTSPRRGGGYSIESFPTIYIQSPPPLGDAFRPAKGMPIMRPTSRVLKINLIDGGEGYTSAPQVSVVDRSYLRPCQATAILDRQGHVESILVLDPGFGYGERGRENRPKVIIDEPPKKRGKSKGGQDFIRRRAKAVAELEYEIVGIDLLSGGSGYVSTEPPEVLVSPPVEDPDWFIQVQDLPENRMIPLTNDNFVEAAVTEMKYVDGNIAFSAASYRRRSPRVTAEIVQRMRRDPLEMLPSYIRPKIARDANSNALVYSIPTLVALPPVVSKANPRFRAQDPIFGAVGEVPVTKGAKSLSTSEYGRLALSGAVCTVLVRTALNPLELIKTKQQLENDPELFDYARSKTSGMVANERLDKGPKGVSDRHADSISFSKIQPRSNDSLAGSGPVATLKAVEKKIETTDFSQGTEAEKLPKEAKLGTLTLLKSLVELRGRGQLFHSADITFLASLVFGSFGFGATELFRRSVSAQFLEDGGESALTNEFALLAAASLATTLTSAAASPFEVLRVKSMGLIEDKKWTEVLQDYIEERKGQSVAKEDGSLDLQKLKPQDILPLWSGFGPIASRELPFAVTKFLVFDLISTAIIGFLNKEAGEGALPIQTGVGPIGLSVSALSGALAGIVAAVVSHPADLILTKTSAKSKKKGVDGEAEESPDWREIFRDIISQDGGFANLLVGLPARATFFFLVIGLQFFLYDYVKNIFQVGSDDLSLVLDVFYAVRAGLGDASQSS